MTATLSLPPAIEGAQVAEVAQVAADELDRRQRLARAVLQLGGAAPLRDELLAALDREPVAEIVAEHHREAGEQLGPRCSARG